jgi:hypothetical protein
MHRPVRGRKPAILRVHEANKRIGIGWLLYTANAVGY